MHVSAGHSSTKGHRIGTAPKLAPQTFPVSPGPKYMWSGHSSFKSATLSHHKRAPAANFSTSQKPTIEEVRGLLLMLTAEVTAECAAGRETRCSTTGYVFIRGNPLDQSGKVIAVLHNREGKKQVSICMYVP